jgi:hypothetical protein
MEAPHAEIAFWRAVIACAIADATGSIRSKKPGEVERLKRERDHTRAWLLTDSRDFRLVCSLALLEPDAVREKAQALERRGWEVRQPAKLRETINMEEVSEHD